jgi:uncharacterized XkdX family phage protein
MFDILKDRYEKEWCRKDQLRQYVALGVITPAEYEEITGEAYEE